MSLADLSENPSREEVIQYIRGKLFICVAHATIADERSLDALLPCLTDIIAAGKLFGLWLNEPSEEYKPPGVN